MKEIEAVRKYASTAKELRKMSGSSYWEVWQGLPNVDFEPTLSRGGYSSLKYERDHTSIWVTNDALIASKQNSNAIYSVMVRTAKDKLIAPHRLAYNVFPSKFTLEETIERDAAFNKEKRK